MMSHENKCALCWAIGIVAVLLAVGAGIVWFIDWSQQDNYERYMRRTTAELTYDEWLYMPVAERAALMIAYPENPEGSTNGGE
jgi:hypothetical protein